MADVKTLKTTCCIAGGGPAGMMLGFLLARAGVDVVVLEKHADFLRDFRGDTIHPSTLELMHELGLLDEFLTRPYQQGRQVSVYFGDRRYTVADFTHLPTRCKFIAFMPQWDFLDFLAAQARKRSTFRLFMEAEVTDLLRRRGRIAGVKARTPQGDIEIEAELTVGADGRHSVVREKAGLKVVSLGAPMDVLWLRLSKRPDDPTDLLFRVEGGRIFIQIDRGDYWQCAFVIAKGSYETVHRGGLESLQGEIARLAPYLADRVGELKTWDDVKLLTVTIDRLKRWHKPGLLCIGDAAHAMSPVGGVGINLAIQDAVATANSLHSQLRRGHVDDSDLARVQHRREPPTKRTQGFQVRVQSLVIAPLLSATRKNVSAPLPIRLLHMFPILRRLPARFVGLGFLPEHVQSPDAPESLKPA